MKIFGSFCFFLFYVLSISAQNTLSFSGTLLGKDDHEPIIAASIELLNSRDSSLVKGVVSNMKGEYAFRELSKGNYIMRASYMGYHPLLKNISLDGNQTSVKIETLYMETSDILLGEMTIEGKVAEMIVKNDTIEYDALSFKTEENAVVEDLLKKLPGVDVDSDGKITAAGKEVKKIRVQGKEFFADDPKIASKNLPAEMVEKVQVVDQKSEMAQLTGFDDGEEETIINLTVRPGMMQGTMGSALVGGGANVPSEHDNRYQAGTFVNHMQETDRYTLMINANNNNNLGASDLGANQFGGMRMRGRGNSGGVTDSKNVMFGFNKEFSTALNLNGDVRYTHSDRFTENKSERVTLSDTKSQLDKSITNSNYQSNNISTNFHLEWKPDTLNTLIFRPNLRYNNSKGDESEVSSRYNYNILNPADSEIMYESTSNSISKGNGISFGGSLNYAHKFEGKPGRVLSFDINGNYSGDKSRDISVTNTEKFIEMTRIPDNINQQSQTDNKTNDFSGTVAYSEPLGGNNFLQLSYRYAYRETQSKNNTFDLEDEHGNIPAWDELPLWAILNDSLSRSTERNSVNQRIRLSFRAARAKYNYTIGLNVDPSRSTNETWQPNTQASPIIYPYVYDSYLAFMRGDSLVSSIKQNVVNFSPMVSFNYNFGQRTHLRINYDGSTNQPSANQLRDYLDQSRPTNWIQGNPNLKPGYSNNIRIDFQKYITDTQLAYNIRANGGFSVNDITEITVMMDEGINMTTYKNVNGNWNANVRAGFNTPLRNKKFSISNFGNVSFRKTNSYVNEQKNVGDNFSLNNTLRFNYRSDLFDVGINGNISYSNVKYSAQPDNNRNTYDYRIGGETTWYLPYNWTVASDIRWTTRRGYTEGYNTSETMWNASVTKQLFNKTLGTGSLKLQIYDILQDQSNISFRTTTNGYRTSETNGIPSFFMCSFIYQFKYFPKTSFASEEDMAPRRGGGGRGSRSGGGRGPGGW